MMVSKKIEAVPKFKNIILSNKPGMAFLKEHQTGACEFDAF
jgi:hypothetical protein